MNHPPTVLGRIARVLLEPIFLLVLLCYLWPVDRYPGANVRAHIDAAAAVVLDGTFTIDRFVDQEPTATIDWARAPDGHYYSNKAPGAALAAVPVFAFVYFVERALGVDALSREWFTLNCTFMNWPINALPSAIAMVLLLHLGLTLGISRRAVMAGTLSIALGTAYYPYATAYYAHNPAANLIIAAAWLIFVPHSTPLKDAGAGFLAGSAVLFDYPAVFAPAVFGLTLLLVRPRALVAFIAGGLAPLAVYVWYHTTVFGSPFVTAASFWNPRFLDDGRAFGGFPRPGLLLALTVSPYRGVFFYSPILLAAIYGAGVMLREHRTRAFAAAALLLFMAWLLMNATYNYWWGGRTTGPRFLVPAVVLFGPMIAVAFERFPRICAALGAVAISNYFAITAVSHLVPATVANPLLDRIYPMFIRGDFDRSNIGLLLGLPGLWSLAPLVLPAVVFTIRARTQRLARPHVD